MDNQNLALRGTLSPNNPTDTNNILLDPSTPVVPVQTAPIVEEGMKGTSNIIAPVVAPVISDEITPELKFADVPSTNEPVVANMEPTQPIVNFSFANPKPMKVDEPLKSESNLLSSNDVLDAKARLHIIVNEPVLADVEKEPFSQEVVNTDAKSMTDNNNLNSPIDTLAPTESVVSTSQGPVSADSMSSNPTDAQKSDSSVRNLVFLNVLALLLCGSFVGGYYMYTQQKAQLASNTETEQSDTGKTETTQPSNPETSPSADVNPVGTSEGSNSGTLVIPEVVAAPSPVSLEIPSIKLKAAITDIGYVAATKEIEVPHDARQVGWYKYSALPGENGSSILTAHYDTPTGGKAIFYDLKDVKEGDEFKIKDNKGKELTYSVTEVSDLPLVNFPKEKIFGDRDFSQVSLMTCSGVWNAETKLYSHRLVVIGKLKDSKQIEADTVADSEGISQYPVQGFTEELFPAKAKDSYMRLEAGRDRMGLYVSSNDKEMTATEAIIKYDPEAIDINLDTVSFTNAFEVTNVRQVAPGVLSVAFFTDPKRGAKQAYNTGEYEVKVADLYFMPKDNAPEQTKVEIVKEYDEMNKSAILTTTREDDLHFAPNILDRVEGTTLKL